MELDERMESVTTHVDLAAFIDSLRADLLANPNEWENVTLDRFLEAMAACSRSMEKAYKNNKREFPKQPSWAMVAELLHAAKMYE